VTEAGSQPPILIASADEQVREVLARLVETAGLEAVRLDPAVDIPDAVVATIAAGLVLDMGAGNQSVLEAIRRRTESTAANVRVVVIGSGPAGGRLALQAGADGYLVRPFHARDLQSAVTGALGRSEAGRHAWRAATAGSLDS
jgi:DNA-binding response OmpR family regulator